MNTTSMSFTSATNGALFAAILGDVDTARRVEDFLSSSVKIRIRQGLKRLRGFATSQTSNYTTKEIIMKRKVSLRFENFTGGWIGRCVKCGTVLASGSFGIPKPLWSACDCKEV